MGVPRLNDPNARIGLILPFRADLSLGLSDNILSSDDDLDPLQEQLLYGEAHLELGIGADFYGLRPSAGLALNSLYADADTLGEDGVAITAVNVGGYLGLRYKHEAFPIYASIRTFFGDLGGTEFVVGAEF